jgi:hypothetical protein
LPDDPEGTARVEPLGAPTDLLRPGGRVADAEVAAAKARMAAKARKVLRVVGIALAAAMLLALLFFVVVALLPKPDL